jgi:(R,R)-butanediol dehydrogenase/meso-butanediol dehydrogenase/diacetyl reductase
MFMKAVQFIETGKPLQLAEVPRPDAEPGCLVFKVKACGICASDLHAVETPGFLSSGNVLGHEFSGEVVEIGPGVEGWQAGDRMVALGGKFCGTCPACRAGKISECSNLIMQGLDLRLPGAYAEYATCLAAAAMKIPENVSHDSAATIEPLAVGLGAWKAANAPYGSHVLILGAGIIGLAVAKWARFFGAAKVGVSEIRPARIERADRVGVDVVIDAARFADPAAEFEKRTGQKPSVIFECIGRPIIHKMIEMAPAGAHLVLVGTGMQPENFTVLSAAMKGLRMTFHLAYTPDDFVFALDMLASGRMTVDSLITGKVSLEETPAMFDLLGKPNDHCKVLIIPFL